MLNLKAQAALAALFFTGAAGAATTNGIANGGFETPGGNPAAGWLTAPTGNPVQLTDDAHTGSNAALLTMPNGFGASVLFQDSVAHGGLPALTAANVGDLPTLTFWAKGDASPTGDLYLTLRYMGAPQPVTAVAQHFSVGANWTQYSFQAMAAVPVGATSLFFELTNSVGPLLDGRTNAVYVDDIQFALTAAVPEPETYALLIAGLAVVGSIARRRRA